MCVLCINNQLPLHHHYIQVHGFLITGEKILIKVFELSVSSKMLSRSSYDDKLLMQHLVMEKLIREPI